MGDWLKPFVPAVRGRAMVRTPPVLARYLDDLAKADRIAGDWDALAAQARGLDDALPPRGLVPPGDYDAAVQSMLPSSMGEPLADALLRNDRTRALIESRLNRLSPEQMPGSLGLVGRQFATDQAAARAADIKYGKDVNTAAALAAAGVLGGGAMYGRTSQLAEEAARNLAENDFDLGPDLSGNPDGAMPMTIDIGDESLVTWPEGRLSRMAAREPEPEVYMPPVAEVTESDLREDAAANLAMIFADDPMMNLEPDSPDDAIASSPGPSIPVGRNMDMEDMPGPQMRSVRVLINAGIPASRAMDIITKGASMSPDEYRMVTGGRR